jgi:hypothetical protein
MRIPSFRAASAALASTMLQQQSTRARGALAAALATTLSLALASTAFAAQPARTVIQPGDRVIPAGYGCAFDVLKQWDATSRLTITDFSDGHQMFIGTGTQTLSNTQAGTSFEWRTGFHRTESYDSGTDQFIWETSGRVVLEFWPGDVDQFGQVVGENGALYAFVGRAVATVDPDSFFITSTTLDGVSIDLCAELAQ